MEIAPPPLNVLCELCKADFPEGKRWKFFDADLELKSVPFRSSSIRQIKDSVTSGCHVCSILWLHLRVHLHKTGLRHKVTKDNRYELHASPRRAAIESLVPNMICLYIRMPEYSKFTPFLFLSRITGVRKRVHDREVIWDINLADKSDGLVGNLAAQCSSMYNIGQRTTIQISRWLQACENEHEHCSTKAAETPPSSTHIFRLIDVGNGNITSVHLVSTDAFSQLPKYTTLSHRWTKATELTQLTWANLSKYFTRIDIGDWPQVYKDAITFTRQLHIRYLWIDSICIIQDFREDIVQQDWDEQSFLMDHIYANSVLNLSSIHEKEGNGFRTSRDVLLENPCVLQGGDYINGSVPSCYLLYRDENDRNAVSKAPLSTRGWVFQERILSKRVVNFGLQMYWECPSVLATEAFPGGYSTHTAGTPSQFAHVLPKLELLWPTFLGDPGVARYLSYALWHKIIMSYAPTKLSNPSDRLVALRGIANVILTRLHLPDSDYAAGMWMQNLPAMMVWLRGDEWTTVEGDSAARRALLHHFPSWSWASCNSSVIADVTPGISLDLIKVISLQGSDDKARTSVPTELILHGWIDTVKPPLTTFFKASPHTLKVQSVIANRETDILIRWDAPTDQAIDSLSFLPVFGDIELFRGLVLQRIATDHEIPTFSRLGFYQSTVVDPVLETTMWELVKPGDWDAKVLLAPLIRLV